MRATGWPVLVCQDAWRLMPWADKLYGCDARWWNEYHGVPDFPGEKWSSHSTHDAGNEKTAEQEQYGLKLVRGVSANSKGFSYDHDRIHYGQNSGFQAINLAILLGSPYIVLVGFDMRCRDGKQHFFGNHPPGLGATDDYEKWVPEFNAAAKNLPFYLRVVNATPGSAIRCFPMRTLEDAIEDGRLYRDRAEPAA